MSDEKEEPATAATLSSRGRPPDGSEPPTPLEVHPSLLIFDEGSVRQVKLPNRGRVLIGRDKDAQVRLDDPRASRKHASLHITEQDIQIQDERSRNGTYVNGERISGVRQLVSRDVITLDQVTMILHWAGPAWTGQLRPDTTQLRQRIAEEIFRAERDQRSFVLTVFDFRGTSKVDRESLRGGLLSCMMPIECAAWGSSARLFVLMPDLERRDFEESVQRFLRLFKNRGLLPSTGYACFPGDACDPDSIIGAALGASQIARQGELLTIDATCTEHQIGQHRILVADPAMRTLYEEIRRLAQRDLTVLIHGESGTGKEALALALHYWSERAKRKSPVLVSAATLPSSLVESQLFGHVKGAFTGATSDHVGFFEQADGSTLFIDEIGELPLEVQPKFLRVLQEKEVIRVGDTRSRRVDFRLVVATNRNLEEEVRAKRFRPELLFRLGQVMYVPPLRERTREIPILAREFLRVFYEKQKRPPPAVTDQAMAKLIQYPWPGNVRELETMMEWLEARYPAESLIDMSHLPEKVGGVSLPRDPREGSASLATLVQGVRAPGSFTPLDVELNDIRRRRLIEALQSTGGVITRAAGLLRLSERTFHEYIKRYGIVAKQYAGEPRE